MPEKSAESAGGVFGFLGFVDGFISLGLWIIRLWRLAGLIVVWLGARLRRRTVCGGGLAENGVAGA